MTLGPAPDLVLITPIVGRPIPSRSSTSTGKRKKRDKEGNCTRLIGHHISALGVAPCKPHGMEPCPFAEESSMRIN